MPGAFYLSACYVLLPVSSIIRQPGVSNILFLVLAKALLFERITLCIYPELIKTTAGHEIVAPGSARKSYMRELGTFVSLPHGLSLLNIRVGYFAVL